MFAHRTFPTTLVMLGASAVLGACGGGGHGSGGTPWAIIDNAALRGVESGKLELSLHVQAHGRNGGDFDLRLSGPFQGLRDEGPLQLDLDAEAHGSLAGTRVDVEGGLELLPDAAYVEHEGTAYELDPTTLGFVGSKLDDAQREGGVEAGGGSLAGCREVLEGLELSALFANPFDEGAVTTDGVRTTQIGSEIDLRRGVDAAMSAIEAPVCRPELAALGALASQSERADLKRAIEENVKLSRIVAFVDPDGLVRQLGVQMTSYPNERPAGPWKVEIELGVKLTDIDREQSMSPPPHSKPLSMLLTKLGVNPTEYLDRLGGEGEGATVREMLEQLFRATGPRAGGEA